jgi:hypothetical protein
MFDPAPHHFKKQQTLVGHILTRVFFLGRTERSAVLGVPGNILVLLIHVKRQVKRVRKYRVYFSFKLIPNPNIAATKTR